MSTTYALYIIWALIPIFFLLMALWSYLEKTAGKKKQERPGDLLKQGLFVGICAVASVLIDIYVLPSLVESVAQDYVPYAVFQVALFPMVLYLAAKIIGPTKDIKIAKAPSSSRSK